MIAQIKAFRENQHSSFFVGIRICIQGAEVTSYIVDTDPISIHYSDREGFNTCSFSLQNAFDNFILTQDNLGWGSDEKGIYRAGVREQKWRGEVTQKSMFQPVYSEVAKKKIYEYKNTKMNAMAQDKVPTDPSKPPPPTIPTFDFKPGTLIINKNDPIRIFMYNPMKEDFGSDEGSWVPMFTGFVDNHPNPNNYINGESIIKITGVCLKAQLQKMRLSFTPISELQGNIIAELVYDSPTTGFFKDLIWADNKGAFQHPFTKKNLHDSISTLLLGDETLGTNQGNRQKVGFMSRGFTFRGVNPQTLYKSEYNDPENTGIEKTATSSFKSKKEKSDAIKKSEIISLEDWYSLIIFGRDKFKMKDKQFYTHNEVTTIFSKTVTYDPDYSPWAARLNMLLPPKDSELTQLIEENIIEVRPKREWMETRYSVIHQLCSLIDYQWITTPMGDFVFEYPMYDYNPYDYGPYWEDVFIVEKFINSDNISTEQGEITTALIVTAGIDTLISRDANDQVPEGFFNRIVVKSDVLAGKYGAKFETWEAPIGGQADKGIKDRNLRIAGLIEFQKRLISVDNASFNFIYHPYLMPNRNLMYGSSNQDRNQASRNKLGWMASVDYTITLFKTIESSVDVQYVRDYSIVNKFDSEGNIIGKGLEYSYLFGGSMMPLSWRDIDSVDAVELSLRGRMGVHIVNEPHIKDIRKKMQEKEVDMIRETNPTK